MKEQKKLRWGIVGLGKIARLFIADLHLVQNAELVAVAATNLERAQSFAEEFGVSKYYGNYEQLFKDEEVDIVYVATLHHTHATVSIAAMDHKKHVLCEKPVGVSSEEARKMVASAKKNDVFFMEAFWSRFNPAIVAAKVLIDQNRLGHIRYINAEFSFYKLDEEEQSRSLNVNLAGGSLLDMGVYPVFLAYLILGKPARVMATSNFYHTKAEIQTSMIFDYDDAQAVLYSGFSNNTDMKAKICGEAGEIFIDPIWHESQGFMLRVDGSEEHFQKPTTGKGFFHEIVEVQNCIFEGRRESQLWSHENSVELMEIVDEVRHKAGIKFPFEA